MEYLEQLDMDNQQLDEIQKLKLKKEMLKQQLQDLTNKFEERQPDNDVQTEEEQELLDLKEALHSYKLTGLSMTTTGANIILKFNPTFGNQYSSADTYCVEIGETGQKYRVVSHSVPAFIPIDDITEKFQGRDLRGFAQHISDYLYAFVQRRETVNLAKEQLGKERFSKEIQTNLPVTHIDLSLKVKETSSTLNIVLDYDLLRSLPTSCEISTADDTKTPKRIPEKRLEKWKHLFLNEPMLSALSIIMNAI